MLARPLLLLSGALFVLLPARAANYSVEPGFDRPGPEYETFEQTSEQMHVLCRDACESQPRCRSYTWVRPGVEGKNAFCHMRDSEPKPVESACCISAVKGGKPARRAVPSLTLAWLGRDADRVGKRPAAELPDGAVDPHLRLSLRIPADQALESIELRGPGKDPLRWSTTDPKAELLAAEVAGRRLLPGEQLLPAASDAATTVDLYAHDIGQWDVDRGVIVEVRFASGRNVTHEVTLTAPPDRLLGTWQMFCSSGGFEPRTISGRILLAVDAERRVSGVFDSLPIVATLDTDGNVKGSAEDAKSHVDFSGRLEPTARGRPLKGSGEFRFTRNASDCADAGQWSSR